MKGAAMPALQVRDFPEDLYEKLKEVAAREHRSVAQQTIVAVEAMVSGEYARVEEEPRRSLYLDFDTEAKRAARIKKRQELFESAKALAEECPQMSQLPADDIVKTIRDGREERSEHLFNLLIGNE